MSRPPYIDPVTQKQYDTNNPQSEGWLTKQSTWLRDWRRRYFILKGSKLFFAKNANAAPHGMIDLSTCITVKSAEMTAKKKNAFEVSTKEETFYIYAETQKEKDEWIGTIGKAIVQSSNTYTNDDNRDDDDSSDEDDD